MFEFANIYYGNVGYITPKGGAFEYFVTKSGKAVGQYALKGGGGFVDSVKFAGNGLQKFSLDGIIYGSKIPKFAKKEGINYGKNKAAA